MLNGIIKSQNIVKNDFNITKLKKKREKYFIFIGSNI